MDMKKILENMDAASSGKKPGTAAEVGSMKAILESFNNVTECGMTEMPVQSPMADTDPVTMNVTLNARGADAIAELITLMGGHKESVPQSIEMPATVAKPDPHADDMDDMRRMISLSSDDGEEMGPEEEPGDEEPDMEKEEWTNSPDEEYSDHHTMTKDLSGGLNRRKKSFKPAAGGDNPMTKMHGTVTKESIKDQLWAALNEKMTTEGSRGKKKKSRGAMEDVKTTEGSRGKSRGKKSRG